MSDPVLEKRDNHCFISYASEDGALAQRIANWLCEAGLRIWFDQVRLGAGAPVVDELVRQVCNSRAFLLVATEKALTKDYVKHEVDIACEQQITQPGFTIIAVRTDPELDLSTRFPSLRKVSWMSVPEGKLDVAAARRILLALAPNIPAAPGTRHIYVSCGWGENEEPVTRRVCAPLVARGVRLIGDAQDQKKFGQFDEDGAARVERIMSGCTGHLLILPARRPPGKTPEEAYKYFLAEWELGRRLGLARRTFCVSAKLLPTQLQAEATEIGTAEEPSAFEPALVELHDETEAIAPYVFLATDFKRYTERNEAARDVVGNVLGMQCVLGKDYPTDQLREAIVAKIIAANLVFADLACITDDASKTLRPNLNTCIEAGIAMGARRPVFVTALDPASCNPEVRDKTTQLPFMFRNHSIQWYADAVDFLAQIHRLALATRRRIINDEIGAGTAGARRA